MPNNIALKVAYDGTSYFGWQKTKEGPSIEERIEAALMQILQHPVKLQAASRTDKGVHAKGQIVNFFTDKDVSKLRYSLNSLLPKDISVLSVEIKEHEFHPTLFAKGKEYHYQIINSQAMLPHLRHTHWHYPKSLDIQKMKEGSLFIQGTHDFKALSNQCKGKEVKSTVCTIKKVSVDVNEELVLIKMVGDRFLYKMARNIAGLLVYVGAFKIEVDSISSILKGLKRADAGISAPACGLTLEKVFYFDDPPPPPSF